MITDIETFFTKGCGRCDRFATADCSALRWQSGLVALRQLCLSAGLVEAVKWGHPCYSHAGRNIAIIVPLREEFRLNFFHAALLRDPDHILERQGPNTAHPDMIRFTDADQVPQHAGVIVACLHEAMGYATAGIVPSKTAHDLVLPDTLVEALDADPELAEAFHRLTPGRQKSYVIALSSAKTTATQVARILRFRPKILNGQGANDR